MRSAFQQTKANYNEERRKLSKLYWKPSQETLNTEMVKTVLLD